jgi:hypothetical protein
MLLDYMSCRSNEAGHQKYLECLISECRCCR